MIISSIPSASLTITGCRPISRRPTSTIIVMATPEAQAAWKATTEPIQQQMRRLQSELRRAPEEQKAKAGSGVGGTG